MGIRRLATLLPTVAPLVHSQGHPALERTHGLRNLQTGLFGAPEPEGLFGAPGPEEVAKTSASSTDDAEGSKTTVSSPSYDPQECDRYIEKLVAKDEDDSGGLSGPEYYEFLSSIDDPPYIAEFFEGYEGFDELPWVFRVVHKSLACHCEQLGFGEGCCEDGKGEIRLEGLEDNGNGGAATKRAAGVYRDLFCQQTAHVLTKSVPSPAPTDGPSLRPTRSPSAGPTPSPSTAAPSTAPVTGVPTRAPSAGPTVSPSAGPTGSPSIPAAAPEPTDAPSVYLSAALPVPAVAVRAVEEEEEEEDDSGNNGVLAAVGGIVACLALLVAAVLFAARRRRARERDRLRRFAGDQAPEDGLGVAPTREWGLEAAPDVGAPDQEPSEDDESSAPSDWSESDVESVAEELYEGHEGPGQTAGSALAAMGAASTVTARIGTINGKHQIV